MTEPPGADRMESREGAAGTRGPVAPGNASLVSLILWERRRRIGGLLAFAAVFLAAGLTTRLVVGTSDGQVEIGRLFTVGGYPLASSLLLLGWLLGRFPLIATLALLAGLFSQDRVTGQARIYAVRPVAPLRIYATRFAVLAGIACLLSALLLPAFDLIMLSSWAGPATFVLILAEVLAYGGLLALLSVWTRADAWITLLLALLAIVWNALRSAHLLAGAPPGVREVLTFVLPPQGAMIALESAYGSLHPIPWDAFAYVSLYGVFMLLLAGLSLPRQEI